MIPEWIESGPEFRKYVFNSHSESVNDLRMGKGGRSIHVGIFDSVYSPPRTVGPNVDIRHKHRHVDTEKEYTDWHGFRVSELIAHFAPYITISFYQTVTEDKDIPVTAFADAIDAAIEDNVDIVNISSGEPWRDLVKTSPHAREAQRLLDEGISVVAAAGNNDTSDEKLPIHCPAAVEDVIAVGGFVTRCPASLRNQFSETTAGPYFELSNSPNHSIPGSPKYLYCGQNGCTDGGDCISKQTEVLWEGNPNRTGGKPDVFAPIHYPYRMENDGFNMDYGTSFAAPIVTGALATAYSELRDDGLRLPEPYQAKAAVRQSASDISQDNFRKLNIFRLRGHLETLTTSEETVV